MDIGAYQGDPILAFAAGTVEYVGENDDHGLYFQIDHGNGIKSFLRTLQQDLCDHGTDRVRGGEGGRGGVHRELHWSPPAPGAEIRGTHLDPAYYIDYKQAV